MTNNNQLKSALRDAMILIDLPKRSALINILNDIVNEVLNCPISDAKGLYDVSVSEVAEELNNASKISPIDHAIIMTDIVANVSGITKEEIRSKSRKREITEARQIAMTLIKTYYSTMSLSRIARLFDKDHATVLHAMRTVNSLKQTDSGFKLKLIDCLNDLSNAGYLFPEEFYPILTKQTTKHEDQQNTFNVQY